MMVSMCSLLVEMIAQLTCGPSTQGELAHHIIMIPPHHDPFILRALEALSLLGGEGLEPFYAMLDGGREGEFFAELEEFFYYAQIRR